MDCALRQTHVAAALRAGRSAVAGFTPRQVPSSLCTGFPSFGVRGGHDDARFPGAALRRHTPMPLARPPQVVTQAVQALRRPMSAARERCLHSSAVLHAPTDEASSRSRSEVVDVLYDGECPLCVHEITWLRRRNQVVNLSGSEFATWHASPRSLEGDAPWSGGVHDNRTAESRRDLKEERRAATHGRQSRALTCTDHVLHRLGDVMCQ
jgi:hypothetical protein